jgi:hypothetical protein
MFMILFFLAVIDVSFPPLDMGCAKALRSCLRFVMLQCAL